MARIDSLTRDRILAAAKIEEVVEKIGNVKLHKSGANYKGLCPFHNDTTPSFMVNPVKNICKCFACGEGGNPVSFLQKHQKISYNEALKELADMYNIEVSDQEETAEEKAANDHRSKLYSICAFAEEFFADYMWHTEEGRSVGLAYFRERGLRDDVIKDFGLGYCPKYKFLEEARKKGYSDADLLELGLCKQGENNIYTFFHDRPIFPIFSAANKPIAFAGRSLQSDSNFKYLNSLDSTVYKKSNELYGLVQAIKEIQKKDQVIVVEGYFDVISMYQAGFKNVVASSGTAFTKEQCALLKRFTSNMLLMLDGDDAGRKATEERLPNILQAGFSVKILNWPLLDKKVDPDSFAQSHSYEEIDAFIKNNSVDFIDYKNPNKGDSGIDSVDNLSEIINKALEHIALVSDQIKRELYINSLASKYNLDKKLLFQKVGELVLKNNRENIRNLDKVKEDRPSNPRYYVERDLIRYAVYAGEVIIQVPVSETEVYELPVRDYIYHSMNDDGLDFTESKFKIIMDAVMQCDVTQSIEQQLHAMEDVSEDFVVHKYLAHTDGFNVEQMASIQGLVLKAVATYKYKIFEIILKEKQSLLKQKNIEKETFVSLIKDINELKQLQVFLNKTIGKPL